MMVLPHYSMSELRAEQAEIFNRLRDTPAVITRQGKPAGVLVAPDKWNALLEQLEDLQDNVDGLIAELALARGEDEVEEFTPTVVTDDVSTIST